MRVCCLYGFPEDGETVTLSPGPAQYVANHKFTTRLIGNHTAQQDVDSVVQEGFDCYIHFLGGGDGGPAEINAVKYLESLGLLLLGCPSRILGRHGQTTGFIRDTTGVISKEARGPSSDEVVYTCTVVEMGETPVALSPFIIAGPEQHLLQRASNPQLYDAIQEASMKAFLVNEMKGCLGCTVHLRQSQETLVITANDPTPPIFQPIQQGQSPSPADEAIRLSFPGGHRAFLNSAIATTALRQGQRAQLFTHVRREYDEVAPRYNTVAGADYTATVQAVATRYDFTGTVLDLACGTGLVGRFYGEAACHSASSSPSLSGARFIGVDISAQMREECLRHGWYEEVLVGPMQRVLTEYCEPVDHLVCMGALHYLDSSELSLVLSRAFLLARRSVTVSVDEIPDAYNLAQRERGRGHMHSWNHLGEVEAYGVPRGWRMSDRWRRLGWRSPTTGNEVFTNVLRFEQLGLE